MICAGIDDLLVITKNNFEDHLKAIYRVIQKLTEARLKLNAEKTFFRRTQTEYLGLWLINNRVRPLSSQVK